MNTKISLFLSIILISLVACGGMYNKECWDDVCKITDNGVVTYEGDPEKIKKILELEDKIFQKQQNLENKYKSLPRRQMHEIIRVAVLPPEIYGNDLNGYRQQFYSWIIAELEKDPKIQVVPYNHIKGVVAMAQSKVPIPRGWNEDGPKEKNAFVPNEESYKKLRDYGAKIDVLLYTSLSHKTESGLVGGRGQGIGVISASRIELSGVASSIYDFSRFDYAVIGKSAGQIDIAGRDKGGKVSSASFNNNRDIKLDQPSAEEFARYYASTIKSQIAPHLPSLEALNAL